MAYGSDIDAQDRYGNTPLHLAVRLARRTQNEYLIIKLIMKGARKDI